MPASSPSLDNDAHTNLAALGSMIRARRQQLRVSMASTAEAAGISRVTLHRIERGGPAVTMGAYLNVITALGLRLELSPVEITGGNDTAQPSAHTMAAGGVRIGDYPQLHGAAWQLDEDTTLTEFEALQLYERNWLHIDHTAMDPREKKFLQHLADTLSHGRLLV